MRHEPLIWLRFKTVTPRAGKTDFTCGKVEPRFDMASMHRKLVLVLEISETENQNHMRPASFLPQRHNHETDRQTNISGKGELHLGMPVDHVKRAANVRMNAHQPVGHMNLHPVHVLK